MRHHLARRLFLQLLGVSSATAAAGCAVDDSAESDDENLVGGQTPEYVVVGSGAGGGPLACNLARAGHRVLLLEAGGDTGNLKVEQVPAFHPKSTEHPDMRWDYFVKHYSSPPERDPKQTDAPPNGQPAGVLYPRASGLGGCTTHHAMITVYPHANDFDYIADMTGDDSWRAANMRQYFERLEKCEYLNLLNSNPFNSNTGHGFKGWLKTQMADAKLGLFDDQLRGIIAGAAKAFGMEAVVDDWFGAIVSGATAPAQLLTLLSRDINTARADRDTTEGVFTVPMATDGVRRRGPREYILDTVAAGFPLRVVQYALASRLLFADNLDHNGDLRAIGVEYLKGSGDERLYRASPKADGKKNGGSKQRAYATREVIVSCGAFNTPQLLKLSGIGPRAELKKLGIAGHKALGGDILVNDSVGTNLQDRYEVGIVHELGWDFEALSQCTFKGDAADPCMQQWNAGQGPYRTNGVAVGVLKRSRPELPTPDLFVFGAPGDFRGYTPGYSDLAYATKRRFTWAVLKAHTENNAGTVTLRSANPRDVPEINFHYFDEGTTEGGANAHDLDAVVKGVELVREIADQTDPLMHFHINPIKAFNGQFEEVYPGRTSVQDSNEIARFVKREAWGHHASCTCPIGPVLDSKLRVKGTAGLRVVDASIFPKIPGFFIVVPIYMISEKAADDILADAS